VKPRGQQVGSRAATWPVVRWNFRTLYPLCRPWHPALAAPAAGRAVAIWNALAADAGAALRPYVGAGGSDRPPRKSTARWRPGKRRVWAPAPHMLAGIAGKPASMPRLWSITCKIAGGRAVYRRGQRTCRALSAAATGTQMLRGGQFSLPLRSAHPEVPCAPCRATGVAQDVTPTGRIVRARRASAYGDLYASDHGVLADVANWAARSAASLRVTRALIGFTACCSTSELRLSYSVRRAIRVRGK
jgi:hypothetical protein